MVGFKQPPWEIHTRQREKCWGKRLVSTNSVESLRFTHTDTDTAYRYHTVTYMERPWGFIPIHICHWGSILILIPIQIHVLCFLLMLIMIQGFESISTIITNTNTVTNSVYWYWYQYWYHTDKGLWVQKPIQGWRLLLIPIPIWHISIGITGRYW